MIPTIFSPVDLPLNYNFESNPLFTKDEITGEWTLKTKKKKVTSWNITGKATGNFVLYYYSYMQKFQNYPHFL